MGAAAVGALSAVSPAMQVVSGFMKGEGDQAAADYQAAKAKRSAEYGRLAATQTDAQSRENLNLQLDNIDAVRTAGNIDPTSPTTAAIKDRTAMIGDRSRTIQVGNIMAQAAQNEADSQYYKQSGEFAYTMDVIGGFTNAASSVSKARGR